MGDLIPIGRLKLRRVVHNLVGQHCIVTDKPYDAFYSRLRVQHWIIGLETGDWIRWNPKLTVDSLATYLVIANQAHPRRDGVWLAELGQLIPDVTIAGRTYPAPSQGFLMPL